ncbi:glycoside hydrolase [bacterium]|nr:glycoside hydrolase [bacterium]
MDSKLNISFLWHQHQPYYKIIQANGKSIYQMPWVRLHAVKDYFDLPRWMDDFPNLKQNFNLVPSLLVQLEDYVHQRAEDRVIQLTLVKSSDLTETDKESILKAFFLANHKRLIFPNKRYHELFTKKEKKEIFSLQDFTDLQVWYNLCWVGEYWKKQDPFKSLLKKGSHFSDKDKMDVIDGHYRIMGEVIPLYQRLVKENKIELSVTPFYHPILPLLCNSGVAYDSVKESPDSSFLFKHPEDAEKQIQKSVSYFDRLFGFKPAGMWPSEGGVSDEALQKIAASNFEWLATDQEILENSAVDAPEKNIYLPHVWQRDGKKLFLVFRDHGLSDAIGFTYSEMTPEDAANDFISRVDAVRKNLLEKNINPGGCLLNVILDGENCWEFYRDNGADFLKRLYTKLSESRTIRSVAISDFLKRANTENIHLPLVTQLHPGSWISHNFDIWIRSHREKNTAWKYVKATRDFLVEKSKSDYSEETIEEAWEEIYLAEGSDWFWWFGDDHQADNKFEFDALFRYHLMRVYDLLHVSPPSYLSMPIMALQSAGAVMTLPTSYIKPKIDGRVSHFYEWIDAGFYEAHLDGDTMHVSDSWFKKVYYGFDEKSVYLRVDFFDHVTEKFKRDDRYSLRFEFVSHVTLIFSTASFAAADHRRIECRYKLAQIFESEISMESLGLKPGDSIQLSISVYENDREIVRRPSRKPLVIPIPDESSDKYLWSV